MTHACLFRQKESSFSLANMSCLASHYHTKGQKRYENVFFFDTTPPPPMGGLRRLNTFSREENEQHRLVRRPSLSRLLQAPEPEKLKMRRAAQYPVSTHSLKAFAVQQSRRKKTKLEKYEDRGFNFKQNDDRTRLSISPKKMFHPAPVMGKLRGQSIYAHALMQCSTREGKNATS